jgi:hypothetical protein
MVIGLFLQKEVKRKSLGKTLGIGKLITLSSGKKSKVWNYYPKKKGS